MDPQSTPPEDPAAQYAKAHALFVAGEHEAAAEICENLMRQVPGNASVHNLLGNIQLGLNHYEAALSTLQEAIRLAPENPLNYVLRGIAQEHLTKQNLSTLDEALLSYDQALALDPKLDRALYQRGRALLQMPGRHSEAAEAFAALLQINPAHELARYNLASLNQIAPPDRAPDLYVKLLFDDYAAQFDEHLIQDLHYAAPACLQQQFARNTQAAQYDILDLGCGTGLSGLMFKSLARSLDGVDLSEPMLAEARKKEVYDTLSTNDILTHLQQTDKRYDLIVAADVFVYIGALDAIFEAAVSCLKDVGFISFSIEKSQAERFQLKASKRYGHSLNYIIELAHRYQLGVVEIQNVVLRSERDQALHGYAILLCKPEALTHSDPTLSTR